MKGIQLSKKFYEQFGEPMLKEQFADVFKYLAIGLVGSGSECYGYDDDISHDHDFEPKFCIFIPDENVIDSKTAFELERAYLKLPKEFLGFTRKNIGAVGGNRDSVIRISDFFVYKTGRPDGALSVSDWFALPEYSLLEATNGEVFADNYGEFSKIRENLSYYPEDIRLKKLCGNLLLMGQSGQYNYNRCILRADTAAAQLAVFEFVKSTLCVIFLLNKQYMPYYKWSFYALNKLQKLSNLADQLEYLISSSNTDADALKKTDIIENICKKIVAELNQQNLSNVKATELEHQAYVVNNAINDNIIRNMNILSAV